jgi:hypothetical protein
MAASSSVVLMKYDTLVIAPDGSAYTVRACGRYVDRERWEGWLEFLFLPDAGGPVLRSRRETTQPDLAALRYWASGLSEVYLAGALERTLRPRRAVDQSAVVPAYAGPAPEPPNSAPPEVVAAAPRAVLDPYAVYAQGEVVLRQELAALDSRHLVNILLAYGLTRADPLVLRQLSPATLSELIVAAVRERSEQRSGRAV